MLKKRFLTALLSLSMVLGLSAPALAVEVENAPAEQSVFGGQTITCQVVDVTTDGITTSAVDVVIPRGTTKSQEDALVYAAIGEAGAINPLARADDNHPDFLAEIQNPEIKDLPGTCLYDGNLPRTYQRILVDITVTSVVGVSNLYVQFRNSPVGDFSGWVQLNYNKYPQRVIFRSSDGRIMRAGDHVEVWTYANPGTITASYAQVAGSPISG